MSAPRGTRRIVSITLAILTLAALGWLAGGRPSITGNTAVIESETWTNPAVVDGDTLDATNPAGSIERIRILGIDAPEWDACGGAEATAYLQKLLDGVEEVQLVRDPSQPERDKYDRVLAYVELTDGTDLGFVMIQAGHARELSIGAPHARADQYDDEEAAGAECDTAD